MDDFTDTVFPQYQIIIIPFPNSYPAFPTIAARFNRADRSYVKQVTFFPPLTNTLRTSSKFKFAKYPKGIKDLILEPRESACSKQVGVPILTRKSDEGGAGVAHFLSLTGQHLYEK